MAFMEVVMVGVELVMRWAMVGGGASLNILTRISMSNGHTNLHTEASGSLVLSWLLLPPTGMGVFCAMVYLQARRMGLFQIRRGDGVEGAPSP